jgi:hypothetical protein
MKRSSNATLSLCKRCDAGTGRHKLLETAPSHCGAITMIKISCWPDNSIDSESFRSAADTGGTAFGCCEPYRFLAYGKGDDACVEYPPGHWPFGLFSFPKAPHEISRRWDDIASVHIGIAPSHRASTGWGARPRGHDYGSGHDRRLLPWQRPRGRTISGRDHQRADNAPAVGRSDHQRRGLLARCRSGENQ